MIGITARPHGWFSLTIVSPVACRWPASDGRRKTGILLRTSVITEDDLRPKTRRLRRETNELSFLVIGHIPSMANETLPTYLMDVRKVVSRRNKT